MARILVIDDSPVMRRLLNEYLTELGHEVLLADDGEQGLEVAQANHIEICVCDMHMPKKTGPEVYRHLTAGGSQIQFIFTDSMPDGSHESLLGTPTIKYLKKPFELEHIRLLLEQLLEPSKQD